MKCVIVAGGFGSRLSEETDSRPKPMVEIGDRPMLWHIMKIYSHFGINDFIVCLGYKGYVIKEYFANYFLHMSDVTFDLKNNRMETHQSAAEPWKVTLIDTGQETMTGGRLRLVAPFIGDETFCFTYGDGVADIQIDALIDHHRSEGKLATVTGVNPPGRFGQIQMDGDEVIGFSEKTDDRGSLINGGFFVLEPGVMDYIEGEEIPWERQPLEALSREGNLSCYRHSGFWRAMDTLRDKRELEALWKGGAAPWKIWK